MTIHSSVLAAAFVLPMVALTNAQAAPAVPIAPAQVSSDMILVEGGCGPGAFRDRFGRCRVEGRPVVVEPPVVVAPAAPVVVAPPVVCERGFRWHPRLRRCVVL